LASLRDIHAVDQRRVQAVEHLEVVEGTIAAAVANFGFARPKKYLQPIDFGLGPKAKRRSKKTSVAGDEDVEMLRSVLKSMAGSR